MKEAEDHPSINRRRFAMGLESPVVLMPATTILCCNGTQVIMSVHKSGPGDITAIGML